MRHRTRRTQDDNDNLESRRVNEESPEILRHSCANRLVRLSCLYCEVRMLRGAFFHRLGKEGRSLLSNPANDDDDENRRS